MLLDYFLVVDEASAHRSEVESVIAKVRKSAADAEFFLVGIRYDETAKTVFTDVGRVGPINVMFRNGADTVPEGVLFSREQIERRLRNGRRLYPVEEKALFNFAGIRERFNTLNSHPDVKAIDIVLTRQEGEFWYGYEDGSSETNNRTLGIDVVVEERSGLAVPGLGAPHLVLGIDNFGSMDGADAWMVRGALQFLNLWKQDHSLTLNGSYSLGGSLYGVSGSYLFPCRETASWLDPSIMFHCGYTDVAEDDVVPRIDVEGLGYFGGMQLSNHLIDNDSYSLDISLGVTYRYVENALVVDGRRWKIGKDNDGITIVPASLALTYARKRIDALGGRIFGTLKLIHNLGGSDLEELQYYRAAIEDEDYTILHAQLARVQLLGDYETRKAEDLWMLFGRLDVQWTADPVVAAEQFGLGGNESVGDSGFNGTLEIRTPIIYGLDAKGLWLGSIIDSYPSDRMQFSAFCDFGYYRLQDATGPGEDDGDWRCSLGLGALFAWKEDTQFRLDWSLPLTDKDDYDTDNDRTVHLAFQTQF